MIEYLTKRKFINALTREAISAEELAADNDSAVNKVRLEFLWAAKGSPLF